MTKFTFGPKQHKFTFWKTNGWESEKSSFYFWVTENKEKFLEDTIESIKNNLLWTSIELIFLKHPELENIGTREQYAQYVETIFPDSICKDIVYHGIKAWKPFDKFEIKTTVNSETKDHDCFFFTSSYKDARSGGTGTRGKGRQDYILPVLLNIKKENVWMLERRIRSNNSCHERGVRKDWKLVWDLYQICWYPGNISKTEVDMLKKEWIDSIIVKDRFNLWLLENTEKWYIVFNPEQIHILWSKDDIQMFKKYINKK